MSRRKKILKDCIITMFPTICIYTLQVIIGGLATIYISEKLGEFVNHIINGNLYYMKANLIDIILMFLISVLIIPLFDWIGEIVMIKNSLKHDKKVIKAFLSMPYEKYNEMDEGEVEYKLENDPIELRSYIQETAVNLISIIVLSVILLVIFFNTSLLYGVLICFCAAIQLVLPVIFKSEKKKYDKVFRKYKTDERRYENFFSEYAFDVKYNNGEKMFIDIMHRFFENASENIVFKKIKIEVLLNKLYDILKNFTLVFNIFVGVVCASYGIIESSVIISMIGYYTVIESIAVKIKEIILYIPIIKNIVDRIEKIYQNESINKTEKELKNIDTVSINNLSYNIENNRSNIKKCINYDDITIHKNEKIVICGKNGTGKTTLLNILCGFYSNYSGQVLFNKINCNKYTFSNFQKNMLYLEQEDFLFKGSVMDNIVMGDSINKESVRKIATEVGIEALLDRTVDFNGKGFSGGEKRKISLARILVRDSDCVLLDEPERALDMKTIDYVINYINNSRGIVIVVTHLDKLKQNNRKYLLS